jgi:hypothetical protein
MNLNGWRPLVAALAISAAPAFALAEGAAVPTQDGWVDARRSVTLESGLSLSYVEMGPAEGQPILLIHGYTDNSGIMGQTHHG